MAGFWQIVEDAAHAASRFGEAIGLVSRPTLRLGVTGLARAGKTVFITALVQALMRGEKLPVFKVAADGRLRRATIEPQPDDDVPRFAIEEHWRWLVEERRWPESTRRISQLRVAIEYEGAGGGGPRVLNLDIVDYPGEWLLDLALIDTDYEAFAADAIETAASPARAGLAAEFLAALAGIDPAADEDEAVAERLADLFKRYLAECRKAPHGLSTLPPGRFLLPGDLEGSPALTFAPLRLTPGAAIRPGSIAAMMQRRYEAYRRRIVAPFFREHFARLDRQIVLVDVLSAMDAGPAAVADLEAALARVLLSFRAGRSTILSTLFSPRIDRVLFAATKADLIHHASHDRLAAVLGLLVDRAQRRVESAGAAVATAALASIRATREATVRDGRETLPAVVGTPEKGETIGGRLFDGETEAAIYSGEWPADPRVALETELDLRFPKFRPPLIGRGADGRLLAPPHIRLDRALEFLLGDKLA